MTTPLRTVIIPAAGKGTRLAPLTRSVPKEMLHVYDKPVLQFALDEAISVGAQRIVIVIHPDKQMIYDFVGQQNLLAGQLLEKSKTGLSVACGPASLLSNAEIVFAVQDTPLGLGHAVLCAEPYLLHGPVGVILPDDLIMGLPCLAQMAAAYQTGHMIAAMDVAPSQTADYGIFKPIGSLQSRSVRVSGMVEKPSVGTSPSTLAAVGRYILDQSIMQTLRSTPTGRGNEIQLTDAITTDAAMMPVNAFRFVGTRFDCGTFDGLLAAGVAQQAKSTNAIPVVWKNELVATFG